MRGRGPFPKRSPSPHVYRPHQKGGRDRAALAGKRGHSPMGVSVVGTGGRPGHDTGCRCYRVAASSTVSNASMRPSLRRRKLRGATVRQGTGRPGHRGLQGWQLLRQFRTLRCAHRCDEGSYEGRQSGRGRAARATATYRGWQLPRRSRTLRCAHRCDEGSYEGRQSGRDGPPGHRDLQGGSFLDGLERFDAPIVATKEATRGDSPAGDGPPGPPRLTGWQLPRRSRTLR